MKKQIFFERFRFQWPAVEELEPFFLSPPGKQWFNSNGNDSAIISCHGLEETDDLAVGEGRIDADLSMWGNPAIGVFLFYTKIGGGFSSAFSSKGDLNRLKEYTRTRHGDLRPVGLYIPFEKAWPAVKEFMETEGALPTSIDWISNKELATDTFPDPHDERYLHIT